eukprot:TRINITY_DN15171_c0_g1_i1.p1 TRINITY_DN15171_c0_g1~~TRINITY_DN15171_c0_g1_i1.p1  ORF type:complete len:420 (-),score=63.68 TRINITY_DN15171_c0_g1_i1:293-1552(-)
MRLLLSGLLLLMSAHFLVFAHNDWSPVIDPDDYPYNVSISGLPITVWWQFYADDAIEFAIQASTSGWVGIGLGVSHHMVPGDLYIGTVQSGHTAINDYFVSAARSVSCPLGVCLDTSQGCTNNILAETGMEADGVTSLKFRRLLNTGDAACDVNITTTTISTDDDSGAAVQYLLVAFGASDTLSYHGANRAVVQVRFSNPNNNDHHHHDEDHPHDHPVALVYLHGALMFLAWPVFASAGLLVARFAKQQRFTWWFRVHIALQLVTVLCTAASVIVAFLMSTEGHAILSTSPIVAAHGWIGLSILACGTLFQPIFGLVIHCLFDPARGTAIPIRDKIHWWVGRITIAAALVNIAIGLVMYEAAQWLLMMYCVVVPVVLVAGFLGLHCAAQRSGNGVNMSVGSPQSALWEAGDHELLDDDL